MINLREFTKSSLYISREYHISLSDIDKLQFWRYEWYLEEIQKVIKEQEKQNKEQEKQYSGLTSSMNPNNMMRNAQANIPKMPSMSMPSMPTIQMPKF